MLTLILNSMEGPMQLVLAKQANAAGNSLCIADSMCWEPQGQGAETLIPNIEKFLERNGLFPASISRIACVRGPGSFTGIRLALATAFGLARAVPGADGSGALLAGVDYLPLLALSALLREHETADPLEKSASLWALTHARRGQVNMQGFSADGKALAAPETLSISEAIPRMESFRSSALILLGSGLTRNRDELSRALPTARQLPESYNRPSPEAFLLMAEKATYGHAPAEPLYLRPCDAEENLPGIAAGLGLDPKEAAIALARLQGRLPST